MLGKKNKSGISYLFIAILLLAVCFFLTGCLENEPGDSLRELVSEEDSGADSPTENTETAKANGTETGKIYVYVCGAVKMPGVYELEKGTRVFQAVQAAGGMTGDASAASVNQARAVNDGEQIYIPTLEEVRNTETGVGQTVIGGTGKKKVNINTAGMEELMTLTGIGEAKARSIMEYREENGGFGKIEELMEIEGIKEGVFNKIKEDIMI